ncbi:MAG: lytic murein transglycosylase [Patescibacteria group bacterium]
MRFFLKVFIPETIFLAFLLSGLFLFATAQETLTPSQERELLEKELKELEQQIGEIERDITKTQQEKDNLRNRISILRSEIKKLNLQITQGNKIIYDLRAQITDTSASIEKTTKDVDDIKKQLGAVLLRLYEQDQKSKVEIVLSGSTLSDFFHNVAALEALQVRLRGLVENLQELNAYLQSQKDALETEKEEEENFVKIQMLQKQENQTLQSQTEQLLEVTKGKESEYQKLLAGRQKRAQEIRSRIFELIGVPEAPTFGEALEIAKVVSGQTSVRPAFLLAVLTQESNIGKNVGQCYLKNTQTGDGVVAYNGKQVRKVMNPKRDVPLFLQITKELTRDPSHTPISCPIPSVGGYGGAMGPAQFIPSTWMGYRERIVQITGKSADPWNIKDAFLAAALYLADGGAAKQTRDGEWKAALIYFSGGTNSRYRFYADSVMRITARYEKDIEALR